MDALETKRLKEEFVSNLGGTTMWEISRVVGLTPVAVFFRLALGSFMDHARDQKKKDAVGSQDLQPTSLVVDFLCIVLPSLYCTTHPHAVWPCILGFLGGAAILVLLAKLRWGVNILCFPCPSSGTQTRLASQRKPFLSKYRSTMMLLTIIDILAVDFPIFPRRFAKTETYGTGLMDVGVGSFVVANGIVSREARGVPTPPGGSLRRVSPLLVLGFARLAAVKAAGYQEHVGEYGVHWNFFFTLAAVEMLTSAVPLSPGRAGLAGVLLIGGYQAVLSFGGLSEVLMSNHRGGSLLSQNKEGVASAFGYWALYLASVQLGRFLAALTEPIPQAKSGASREGDQEAGRQWWRVAGKVWALQMLLWLCTGLADAYVERVSRRTCNLAYVLWMLAFNLQAMSLALTFDLLLPPRACTLLDALDLNLLPSFLLGNVLTGLVNMSMNTLETPPAAAFLVLTIYVAVTCCTAAWLHRARARLAFW